LITSKGPKLGTDAHVPKTAAPSFAVGTTLWRFYDVAILSTT